MVIHNEAIFQNRKHAAFLLGERLMEYENTDAVVIAVPGGGIHIGAYLSTLLKLPLDVIPCKKIKHPADSNRTIGAVSIESVVIREEEGHNIPQDYIYHQIQLLKHVIQAQQKTYTAGRLQACLKNKIVILVDDMLKTGDTMLASLKSIRRHHPKKIVVAVPNVTPEATKAIAAEIDEIIYLTIEPNVHAVDLIYTDLPTVKEEEVIDLLCKAYRAGAANDHS